MISNYRASPFHRQPYRQPYHQPYGQQYGQQPARPFVQEDTLKICEIQIEKKYFVLTLKGNPRGRLFRISEDVAGKRNSIIIPETGLKDFQKLLTEMLRACEELPAKTEPARELP
jgi:hypothetical protein